MSGSSNLVGTDHTNQVKHGNLSVGFILSEEDKDYSDDESSVMSDSDSEWWSCDDEDEYFYDSLVSFTGAPGINSCSQQCGFTCLTCNTTSSSNTTCDTPEIELFGMTMDLQPYFPYQVPEVEETNLMYKGQVPEFTVSEIKYPVKFLRNQLGLVSGLATNLSKGR